MEKMALCFANLEKGKVRCELCPHHCELEDGQVGYCLTRKNEHGVMLLLNYGQITSINFDPIEKKPLFHFNPGEKILSIGSFGCNMKCAFCQNWEISQQVASTRNVSPEQLISIAMERGSRGIAYTYNEPIVWFEFVLDTSRIALKEGIYNVVVTNGLIEEEPLELLVQSIHAMNIDLKGFNEEFYRKMGGDLKTVLRTISKVVEHGIHVELTTLVIEGENDNLAELEQEFKWIANLNENIPLHLSRYFPNYKFTKEATSLKRMSDVYKLAKNYLKYVYLGNVWNEKYESTFCPQCGAMVIRRTGYEVEIVGLDEKGRCSKCGLEIVKYF